jgi:presenilin-like A22 family membrane protease
MGIFILVSVVLAMLLVPPFVEAELQAFEDPGSIWNSVFYIALVLVFTLVILIIIRINREILVKAFMAFAVLLIIFYVAFGILSAAGTGGLWSMVGGISLAAVLTVVLLVYPEWFVINIMGLLVAAGAIALFGVSLSIAPVLVLLIALAVYDAIAVYRTGHMLDLAEGVIDMKMPILFVLPRRGGYSFYKRQPGKDLEEDRRDALFMGVGDAVIPSILPVSALVFIPPDIAPVMLGMANLPALLAVAGMMVGFVLLMALAAGGKPQAGLPLLNGGSIAGYLAGCAAIGIPFI